MNTMTSFASIERAVVLLSGGLDSATVAAIAAGEGFEVNALSFSYGQRHSFELAAAKRVAESLRIAKHRIATIGLVRLRRFGFTIYIKLLLGGK